jgi:hypothetical protein
MLGSNFTVVGIRGRRVVLGALLQLGAAILRSSGAVTGYSTR